MFPSWRIKLREAKTACKLGRLDEADALLNQGSLHEYLPAKKLSAKVAEGIVERAKDHLNAGESAACWNDLTKAERLGGKTTSIGKVQKLAISEGLVTTRNALIAAEPERALAQLSKMARRQALSVEGRTLLEIAEQFCEAKLSVNRGDFAEAISTLMMASKKANTSATIEVQKILKQQAADWTNQQTKSQRLKDQLFTSLEAKEWSSVIRAAEAILEISPQYTAAQKARRRAWKEIGLDATQIHTPSHHKNHVPFQANAQAAKPKLRLNNSVKEKETTNRRLLWIDAVGGYLLCLDDEVVLGQPSSHEATDLPFLADLSRHHAALRRESGEYILEAFHATKVDGQSVKNRTVLANGQVITLGNSVQLRFIRPHVLSATARLEIVSNHKTQPNVDGIILFADSCILGPNSHSHILCRKWENDVVLFRQEDAMFCRSAMPLNHNGASIEGQIELQPGAHIEGEDFSFTFERTNE